MPRFGGRGRTWPRHKTPAGSTDPRQGRAIGAPNPHAGGDVCRGACHRGSSRGRSSRRGVGARATGASTFFNPANGGRFANWAAFVQIQALSWGRGGSSQQVENGGGQQQGGQGISTGGTPGARRSSKGGRRQRVSELGTGEKTRAWPAAPRAKEVAQAQRQNIPTCLRGEGGKGPGGGGIAGRRQCVPPLGLTDLPGGTFCVPKMGWNATGQNYCSAGASVGDPPAHEGGGKTRLSAGAAGWIRVGTGGAGPAEQKRGERAVRFGHRGEGVHPTHGHEAGRLRARGKKKMGISGGHPGPPGVFRGDPGRDRAWVAGILPAESGVRKTSTTALLQAKRAVFRAASKEGSYDRCGRFCCRAGRRAGGAPVRRKREGLPGSPVR